MLAWSVPGLLAAAVAVAARWVLHRRDALGRPRRFPALSVTLLVLPAAAIAVPVWHHHQLQARLGEVASVLAGHRVEVHCQTLGEEFVHAGSELGSVAFDADGVPARSTALAREVCDDLQAYLDAGGVRPTPEQVVAVHVLGHEAQHLTGTADEAQAECAAVQRDALTAHLLGADPAQALRLARLYWAVQYPNLSDGYRSPLCAPGAAWDEHLPDAPWSEPTG